MTAELFALRVYYYSEEIYPEMLFQSINRSINLFVQMQCNKHWTGHLGRMQPPLTGARKNNVSKSNKRQYLGEKNKI